PSSLIGDVRPARERPCRGPFLFTPTSWRRNMSVWRSASRWLSILIFSATTVCTFAQAPSAEYTPEVGQSGNDVVWRPSPQELVDKMLDMAKVTPKDYVIDLGSGDGRTVITAAKRGARALGVEFNPDMVALSRRNAAKAGVSDKASFVEADIFRSDLSPATVITLFLLTELNLKLRPTILTLKPGTRVVSNTFRMGDWEPDQTVELGCDTYCTAYLWIVPARVEGRWKTARGELALKQEFQKVSGTLNSGNVAVPISRGNLSGDQIRFVAAGAGYRAGVEMEGPSPQPLRTFSRMSALESSRLISPCSRESTGAGTPAAVKIPIHAVTSSPGKNSLKVGRSGNVAERFFPATASPRSLPA